MPEWFCPEGHTNAGRTRACVTCGAAKPSGASISAAVKAMRCDCGAALLASGLCADTGLYPVSAACPFACPVCRGPLIWSGLCRRCVGSRTPSDRRTWRYQDRFKEDKRRHHWVKVCGPQRACTPEENKAAMAIIKRVLAGEITAEVGRKEMDVALGTVDGVRPEGSLADSPW